MACINKLSGNIEFNCEDKGKARLAGNRAVLINFSDIDRGSTTVDGATITSLALKQGASGYKLSWYKDLASGSSEFTADTEQVDGFTQSFLGRLPVTSAENAERARELSEGKFVVVYETVYQGLTQEDAYKVVGFEEGLALSEMTLNTSESNSSILFTLSTPEGSFESYPFQIFLETDYETTSTTVEALFASLG